MRTNRHPADCAKCGNPVAADAGTLQGPPWKVFCVACLPRVERVAIIRITKAGDDAIRVTIDGRLSSAQFDAYRDATRGSIYEPATRSNRISKTHMLLALERLQTLGLPVQLDDAAQTLVSTLQSGVRQAQTAASEMAAVVDDALQDRGSALYGYQKTGIRWLATRFAALLGDDMGLGKTIQALVAAPAGKPVLVVCPKVAKGVWAREAARWRHDLTAAAIKTRKDFRWPQAGELLSANYESLPRLDDKGHLPEHIGAAPAGLVLIADEAHAVKNNKAARTKAFRAIGKAARAAGGQLWLMTGTPLLNRPPELWAMLQAADLARVVFGSWPRFVHLMGGYDGARGIEWDPRRVDPRVGEMLKDVMLRRLKIDVLPDLPEKTYDHRPVNGFSRDVRRAADEALVHMRRRGYDLETVDPDQIGGVPFEEMSRVREQLAAAKIPAMLSIVAEYEETETPLVVFSDHRAPVLALSEREGWAAITGDTAPEERTRIENAFQAGKLRGVAATIKAGGVAITLTRASNLLFVDRSYVPANNSQAEDRIYRIGQKAGVVITDLVGDHPLEHRLYALLATKRDLVARTVDAAAQTAETEIREPDLGDLLSGQNDLAEMLEAVTAREAAQAALAAALVQEADDAAAARAAQQAAEQAAQATISAIRQRAQTMGLDAADLDGFNGGAANPRRPANTDVEQWVENAVATLCRLNPDRAQTRNDIGWNKADQRLGHVLGARIEGGWTDLEWKVAAAMVAKYWRQVGLPF
jgi:SWI/SNF-related matrix-associated actin-dependent regulator of chromatin subfamily A-like protein 1